MKKTMVLLVAFAVLNTYHISAQQENDAAVWTDRVEAPAQSLPEALALVELYSSNQRAWLNPGADHLIHSPDFEKAFAVYGDGHCLQQMAGWEGFRVDTELEEHTWFIGFQHPHLDKQIVFRVMRDGRVTVLVPEDALLMADGACFWAGSDEVSQCTC